METTLLHPKKLKSEDFIKCKILHQGAPVINGASVREISKRIIAIEVDMKSKYCDIDSYEPGGDDEPCGLYIIANKESLNLNKKAKLNEPTYIQFPQFVGWSIFSANTSRYTVRVCLIKNK